MRLGAEDVSILLRGGNPVPSPGRALAQMPKRSFIRAM
jgi:hypothetical protein